MRGFGGWLAGIFDRLEQAGERRRARRLLYSLDGRALEDLGIGRGEIERVVDAPPSSKGDGRGRPPHALRQSIGAG